MKESVHCSVVSRFLPKYLGFVLDSQHFREIFLKDPSATYKENRELAFVDHRKEGTPEFHFFYFQKSRE